MICVKQGKMRVDMVISPKEDAVTFMKKENGE